MFELYIFAILITLFLALGLNVIISQNPVYSILYLVLFFITGSSLLGLFGFDYLSLIFILVYVGAIAVLFLFVIMILDIKIINKSGFDATYLVLLALLVFFSPFFYYAAIFLINLQNLLFDFFSYFDYKEYAWIYNSTLHCIQIDKNLNFCDLINESLFDLELMSLELYLFCIYKIGFYGFFILLNFCFCEHGFVLSNDVNSLYEFSQVFQIDYDSSVKNFQVLYTDFMSLFILCGGVLLVAMTGCISLALPVRQQLPERFIRRRFRKD